MYEIFGLHKGRSLSFLQAFAPGFTAVLARLNESGVSRNAGCKKGVSPRLGLVSTAVRPMSQADFAEYVAAVSLPWKAIVFLRRASAFL
jgi:hypothetical protein